MRELGKSVAKIQIEASMTCNLDEVDESNKPPTQLGVL